MSFCKALIAGGMLLASSFAHAADENYPSKPITIVNLYAAGGGIDVVARAVAQKLSEKWKVPVLIENKPGAGGTLAAGYVAKQPADGYTFFVTDVSFSIVPSIYTKLNYDPLKDLQPVILLNTVTQAFTIRPGLGVRSVKELVALSKAEPGKLTYASAGTGSLPHLGAEMFKKATGADILQIPYRGSIPAFTDLLAGRVDMYIGALATPLEQIKTGKLMAIAVMQQHRSALVPDVPSIAELGYPELDFAAYYGILAPSGVPKPVLDKFVSAVQDILKTPDLQKLMELQGNEAVGDGPEKFKTFLSKSTERWHRAFQMSGAAPM
ncbi:MAG: tripartite tricarboxylate transporter substrate binding protein [Rhizobiales bacterium]|nr:tripartite tricarboxylate transporter substrate binding protein [Hyphomicrobiales bacterium]OJY45843.1 MAG: hypothetical protein BGP08_06470 [Rhizobiales bacterium 64-17]